jgi:ribosomal protein S18 acetylase RimI-like enzyme
MGISIRPWQKGDLPSIRRITWESWISTYSSFIPETDIKSYFNIHYTEASLLSMFEDSFMQGFIAETDDQIVGYVRLFFNRDENRLYVPSLHVLAIFQDQGIGRKLLEEAERCAVEKNLNELWIGVMVKNSRALDFYRKVGFQFVLEEPFTMGKTTVSHLIGYKKIGKSTFIHQKIYATFDGEGSSMTLPKLCLEFLSEQKKTWLDLRKGYESLRDVRERDVPCKGFSVRIQCNPMRIKSSTADVDKKNRKEQRCFLCLDHLPEDQKGILYRSDYLILCNPMPIFTSHFTVSHLDHRRQAIDEHIDTFLKLMADFGSEWTILYNGPRCGASAPDHLHFQVVPSGQLPIENEIWGKKKLVQKKWVADSTRRGENVLFYHVKGLGREVIILEGDDPIAVGDAFKSFLNALKKVLFTDEEPMMNIAGIYKERKGEEMKWCLLIFPRLKHRPDAFFKDGDARVVISPGVIDMGGLLITPVEKDFNRVDATRVERIYREVSLEEKTVESAIEMVK